MVSKGDTVSAFLVLSVLGRAWRVEREGTESRREEKEETGMKGVNERRVGVAK